MFRYFRSIMTVYKFTLLKINAEEESAQNLCAGLCWGCNLSTMYCKDKKFLCAYYWNMVYLMHRPRWQGNSQVMWMICGCLCQHASYNFPSELQHKNLCAPLFQMLKKICYQVFWESKCPSFTAHLLPVKGQSQSHKHSAITLLFAG